MQLRNRTLLSFVSGLLLLSVPPLRTAAQSVTATVSIPGQPSAVAVNPSTDQIYVIDTTSGASYNPFTQKWSPWITTNATAINGGSNSAATLWGSQSYYFLGGYSGRWGSAVVNPITNQTYAVSAGWGNVVVIDDATNAVTSTSASSVWAVALNLTTNKIYGTYNSNNSPGGPQYGFTVIDGASNAVTTVSVSGIVNPCAVDVNPVTNKVYVANNGSANVTVIDGASNTFTNVPVGNSPVAVAVNPLTNQVYVVNNTSNGTVTVIDGATNATTSVPVGDSPAAVAINPVTNQIYVANNGSNNITVIDGATNATTTLKDQSALGPAGVAVDAMSNQIYVTNSGSATVTVIDGTTNALTTVTLPNASGTGPIALNPLTNTVYVGNGASNNVSVIAGIAGSGPPDFALGATPASLTVPAGGQATDTIVVGPPYGNVVDLSCSVAGPSPTPACDLSLSSIAPGPTYGTATLTITAPTPAAMLAPSYRPRLGLYAAWLPLLFGIAIWGRPNKRRALLSAGFLLLFLVVLASCGGNSQTQNQTTQTPPQTYTVTVTGTLGPIQHTAQITVTVQ